MLLEEWTAGVEYMRGDIGAITFTGICMYWQKILARIGEVNLWSHARRVLYKKVNETLNYKGPNATADSLFLCMYAWLAFQKHSLCDECKLHTHIQEHTLPFAKMAKPTSFLSRLANPLRSPGAQTAFKRHQFAFTSVKVTTMGKEKRR